MDFPSDEESVSLWVLHWVDPRVEPRAVLLALLMVEEWAFLMVGSTVRRKVASTDLTWVAKMAVQLAELKAE